MDDWYDDWQLLYNLRRIENKDDNGGWINRRMLLIYDPYLLGEYIIRYIHIYYWIKSNIYK